jgi:regulator of sigma E protease
MAFLAFVGFFGALVFVHELGHFLAAKLLGVKVLRFSVGFGPRLLGFERGGTEYWLAALPLGGYVKMAGQDPTQPPGPEDAGRGFFEQAPWKRLVIALAGPLFNLVFPVAIFASTLAAQRGTPVPAPVIGTVTPGWPADQAGLRQGDRILSVAAGGQAPQPVRYFDELAGLVNPHAGEPVVFQVARADGTQAAVTVRPRAVSLSDGIETVRFGRIGITPYRPLALVTPAVPGAAGPLQPFDLVVKADGKPVADAYALEALIAAARCAPLDLDVVRDDPARPDGAPAGAPAVPLRGVPTCAGDRPAIRLASPALAVVVRGVDPGSPAAQAGVRPGDVLTSLNGHPVASPSDLEGHGAELKPGVAVKLGLADGRAVSVVPGARLFEDETTGKQREQAVLGLQFADSSPRFLYDDDLVVEHVAFLPGAGEVLARAVRQLGDAIRLTGLSIAKLLTGGISLNRVSGPVGLFRMTSMAAEVGFGTYLKLIGVVSVNLALMNLLPIPILDGGNIGQALVEMVMRRPLSVRTRIVSNGVGLALLLALMSVVFWNDIVRWLRDLKVI